MKAAGDWNGKPKCKVGECGVGSGRVGRRCGERASKRQAFKRLVKRAADSISRARTSFYHFMCCSRTRDATRLRAYGRKKQEKKVSGCSSSDARFNSQHCACCFQTFLDKIWLWKKAVKIRVQLLPSPLLFLLELESGIIFIFHKILKPQKKLLRVFINWGCSIHLSDIKLWLY